MNNVYFYSFFSLSLQSLLFLSSFDTKITFKINNKTILFENAPLRTSVCVYVCLCMRARMCVCPSMQYEHGGTGKATCTALHLVDEDNLPPAAGRNHGRNPVRAGQEQL